MSSPRTACGRQPDTPYASAHRDDDIDGAYRDWLTPAWPLRGWIHSYGGGLKSPGQEGPIPLFWKLFPGVRYQPGESSIHAARAPRK